MRSTKAANSPQVATAVLRVLPAGTDVGAILSPNELTFNSTAGGESPSSQIVSVYDLTAKPKAFTASSSSGFVQLSPVTGLVTPDQPTLIVVQPFTRALAPGTYQTSITLQFDDSRVRWSATMAPVIMGNPDRAELGEELTNSFCRTDPEIAKSFARATFLSDHRGSLSAVRVPTLILQCSQDVIAPQYVGEYVHRHIPGSKLVIMRATGHCPNLSAPEETIAAIEAFL